MQSFMQLRELVGSTVTFYLVGGQVITAKVSDVTAIVTTNAHGNIERLEALNVVHDYHRMIVRADLVAAFEIH